MDIRDYKIEIYWYDLDNCFIANVPELEYCSAHGETREEALREIKIALEAYLESMATEEGLLNEN